MSDSKFYVGRSFNPKVGETAADAIDYDPADLTTHAVVTGMTGSGKTGLCVVLLEEAALQGIPALVIDPKGDLTNLLLHFPDLAPRDFQPWVDPDTARRAGKTPEQAASEAALAWRNGLAEWGIPQRRLLDLKDSAQFAIFTPGSDSGLPVSVLSSLAAPDVPWDANREALLEKISSTVTALLGMVGVDDVDPLRSREHILLASLFENAWSQGKSVDMTELILQTQTPPFDKLGAFPVDTFFPPKDRTGLAMQLNNILAAPGFEAWRQGQPLDVSALLYTRDGKPRHSVFYIAHLSDKERMFFVTLLFTAVEAWMRAQSGSSGLRALLYMDEIFGYLPPTAIPPSKPLLLRMLKQARAFGLGLVLATQNPVDLDYKALSNAGTWFIGKLQTDQDKQRLLDGLESAAGGVSRADFDKLISSLGKRMFILQNVHAKAAVTFQTRWAMNYLAGPLTRSQLPALNELVQASSTPPASAPRVASASTTGAAVTQADRGLAEGSQTKPGLPAGIAECFLPQNHSLPEALKAARQAVAANAVLEGVVYRPALLASAQVRFLDRKHGVDTQIVRAALVASPERRGAVRWDDFPYEGPSLDKADASPTASSRFGGLDALFSDTKLMSSLQRDFADWAYRTSQIKARANDTLKVYAGPDATPEEFAKACANAAYKGRDAEIAKKTASVDRKIKTLQDKLAREERELRQDQEDSRSRSIEAGLNSVEAVAGLFGFGRKKSLSTPVSKLRMAQNAREDVRESEEAIAQYQRDIADLQQERQQVVDDVTARWGDVADEVAEVTIGPKKSDVYVEFFGVGWMPYYQVRSGSEALEVPAFGAE